jgi:hypothetical protein
MSVAESPREPELVVAAKHATPGTERAFESVVR